MSQQPTPVTSQPFVVGPDGGEHVRFLGTRMTIKATAASTAGALGVVEVRAAPGFSPPLHLHHREDEAFWLLEGSMTVLCDGQTFEASAGSLIWLPRGLPHTFRVDGDTPARPPDRDDHPWGPRAILHRGRPTRPGRLDP